MIYNMTQKYVGRELREIKMIRHRQNVYFISELVAEDAGIASHYE